MSQKIRFFAVLVCSAIVVILYYPATTGALYYDDYANLDGLAGVKGWESTLDFIFSGTAGPLGRPLALLSYVPFAAGWPENSAAILFANITLHAINFILLYFLGHSLLARIERLEKRAQFYAALTAALMWAVLPILASTSLIAIQRMTGLASFFGFLGLLGFVKAYDLYERNPLQAFVLQFGALGIGTLLSIYSKESGAIFPVLALVIDCYVRQSNAKLAGYDLVRRLILICPLIFILYYISPLRLDWFAVDEFRGFSPVQRLFNEFLILWEYLYRAFVPQVPRQYGPFHDYYGAQPITLGLVVAGIGWGGAAILAVVFRKQMVWFSFAIMWFLGGHLVESTTTLLELYFEHRNYVAVYGFCLALSVCVFKFEGRLRKVLIGFFYAYILLLAAILYAVTTLWGNPGAAAESWSAAHPGSARAALHAVFIETGKDKVGIYDKNKDYVERERYDFALRVLDRTKQACPDCIDIRIQALMYSCLISDDADRLSRLQEIQAIAPMSSVNVTIVDQVFNLAELVEKKMCGAIEGKELVELIDSIELARKFNIPEYGARISFAKAMVQENSGDIDGAWTTLIQAESISLDALPVLQYQVYLALKMGMVDEARKAVNRRRDLISQGKLDGLVVESLQESIDEFIKIE